MATLNNSFVQVVQVHSACACVRMYIGMQVGTAASLSWMSLTFVFGGLHRRIIIREREKHGLLQIKFKESLKITRIL